MAKVLWQRLILRGFGRYRDEYEIELSDYSILVLPNESGKSTLVAGLAAVIFGLPATSDTSKFGQARYRNWDDPAEFSGELYFAVSDTQYHLTRNFATHQVSLRYDAQGHWVQMPQATGTDNPSATRPFRAYQKTLQQLLGISSLDLFLATFCITQPLPTPEGLDEAVQGLLAGAGGKATRVQQLLETELKQITRFYGEPLGRARGGNKDRQLEALQAEITELRQQMEAGQAGSEELQVVRSRLVVLSQERQAKQNLLAARTNTMQAWGEWRTQAERYQHGLEQQQRVDQALYRARQLEEQAQQLRFQMEPYALFVESSAIDWNPYIEQQLARERELARIQGELEQSQDELAQLQRSEEQILRNYRPQEQELAAAVEQAQQHYSGLVTQDAACSELEQDFQARFGNLQLAPAELLSGIQHRMQRPVEGQRRQKQDAKWASLAWASRLGGMMLGAASYWFWGRTAGPLGIGVSLACILLGWLLPLLSKSSKSAAGEDAISIALNQISDLGALQTRLEDLLAAQANRPTTIDLTAAQTQLARAQTELASCQGMITAFSRMETSGRSNIVNRIATQQAQINDLKAQLTAATAEVSALGATTPVHWVNLRQEYQAYHQLAQKLGEIRQAQAALWAAQQVDDLAGLERRALDLQNNLAVIRLAWQTLIDNNPGLPSPGDDTRRGAPHVRPQEQHDQLKAEIATLQQELATLQREEENLLRRRAQLEGQTPLNLAVAYERLHELKQQEERLSIEADALGLAYRELEAARIAYSTSHRQRLADQASTYFSLITGQPQRRVELDVDFAVTLRGDAGQPIHPAQLSQGARDQLYLSLRLAIANLLAEDVRLPLILDDPFVNCDSDRLERIRQALTKIAETRQIWLLTHNRQFADWIS